MQTVPAVATNDTRTPYSYGATGYGLDFAPSKRHHRVMVDATHAIVVSSTGRFRATYNFLALTVTHETIGEPGEVKGIDIPDDETIAVGSDQCLRASLESLPSVYDAMEMRDERIRKLENARRKHAAPFRLPS